MTITMRVVTPAASVASLLAAKKLFLAVQKKSCLTQGEESFKKAKTPQCACVLFVTLIDSHVQ